MIAYPLGGYLPYRTLQQRLWDHYNVEVRTTHQPYVSPEGTSMTFRYLFRQTSDGARVAALPPEDFDEISVSVVRSICARLDIDYETFLRTTSRTAS